MFVLHGDGRKKTKDTGAKATYPDRGLMKQLSSMFGLGLMALLYHNGWELHGAQETNVQADEAR